MISKRNEYYVYILTNSHKTTLYVGVTNDLLRRIDRHKEGTGSLFANKYKATILVYYEATDDVISAITREKQIKAGSRINKIKLIDSMNPEWRDLSDDMFS